MYPFFSFGYINYGGYMSNSKRYNIFIFISSFARNLIEVFSAVFLYKKGFTLKEIMLFYSVYYFVSVFVNILTILISRVVSSKYILIISSMVYAFCFYYLSVMNCSLGNLMIFSVLFAVGCFTYHPLRHKYGIISCRKNLQKQIGSIVIITYLALTPSSLIGGYISEKYGLLFMTAVLFVISIIGIIPLLKFKDDMEEDSDFDIKSISKNRIFFFVLEQFKVVFVTLVPLYLFLNIKSDILYLGVINLFICLSAVIFIYIFIKRDVFKYFPYLNIIFCIILILKLNISSRIFMLVISFMEGFFLKMYEVCSTKNMYMVSGDISKYLIFVEIIFCSTRGFIFLAGYLFNNLTILLYVCIFFVFISGFLLKKNTERLV